MIAVIGPSLVLCLLIAYEIRKNTRKEKKASDDFWARENEANSTRKKDISKLEYITVPLDSLPLGLCPAYEELTANEDSLRELAGQQIFNLEGRSNTDVKLEYGVANFEHLCACDERYLRLLQLLSKEAELLYSMMFEAEAEQILSYSLSIGSDIPKDYIMLAEIYRNRGDHGAVSGLIEKAESLEGLTKKGLVEKLEGIFDSF